MLELSYPIEPDEHGVIDGIRLSKALISSAVDLLIPYISDCSGCLDTAFSKLANEVLEVAHQQLKAGTDHATIFTPGLKGEERDAAIDAHIQANQDAIYELRKSEGEDGAEDVHLH